MIAAAINEWADDGPTGGGALAKGRSDVVADEPGDGISLVGESLRPTGLTCPECRGVLWTSDGAGEPHFRCRVGHRFTFETLRHLQRTEVERSMWAAVRALEEEASLCRQIATRAESNGRLGLAMRFGRRHDSTLRHADTLRDLLHHFGDPAPVSGRES
jgi:two-component system chemotaxis response regulator CheB